ncbi:MAG TPA: hypothetical protein HA254_00770 [Candidatus Diapherotrites archaeon]|uniref:Uncharacterized protein n=1 Tax=Candidatus Iainarchaeum sp. TaxID=3101447 RepID=A0A7J4IUJ4_9ARCH|nr:hypothetical protein [Candidatus Diapherotrites archaeon]
MQGKEAKENGNAMKGNEARAPKAKFNAGAVQVCMWENETKEGKPYAKFSIDKRYKDGEQWKSANSLRLDEIPKAIVALQRAYEYATLKEQHAQG